MDSPSLIITKLDNIKARLDDVVREVNTTGTKHKRPDDPAASSGNNAGWESVANGPKGQIGLRNGKWYFTKTGKEYEP